MKILLLVVFVLLLPLNAYSQEDFYDYVLCKISMSSPFVAVNVESPDYSGVAVIESESLFSYFSRMKKFDSRQYRSHMKKVLTENQKIALENTSYANWGFRKVEKIEEVENNASKSQQEFLSHYFEENGFFKGGVGREDQWAVIAKLFQWRIVTYRVDISARLKYRLLDNDMIQEARKCSNK
jgi:hypothetical protein